MILAVALALGILLAVAIVAMALGSTLSSGAKRLTRSDRT